MTSLVVLSAAALCVTISFVSAAVFVAVLQTYGPIEACLSVSAIFFIISLLAAAVYFVKKRRAKARALAAAAAHRARSKSHAGSMFADPMLLTAGLQIIRAIGVKKLVPLLAVAGIAAGFFANRGNASSDEEQEDKI